jgi:hypothetical protein
VKRKLASIFFLFLFLFACNGYDPVEPPEPPIEPPEEVVLYDWEVCLDSNKLRHTWCPSDRIEVQKYAEGEEPQAWCDFHVEPEAPLPELAENLRVVNIRQQIGYPLYVSAFFAKDLGINHTEFEWEDTVKFLDKIAKEQLSNTVRMFAWLAYPSVVNIPHPEKANGMYDLNKINPIWWEQLHRTIEYAIARGLMVRLVIFDEHSFNRRWNWHWTNPDNNDGYRRKDGKMYQMYGDKYGHTKWANYCVRDDDRCDDECKEQYCTNMEYWFWIYEQVIKRLNDEFGDYIAFETNELNAAAFWHDDVGKLLQNEYGIPKWRMITSPKGGVEWINTKQPIRKYWLVEVHGIRYMSDYDEVNDEIVVPWIWSWDGYGGRAFVDRWGELQAMSRKSLNDGNYGIGGNNWLTNDDLNFDNIDYKSGEIIMDELSRYMSDQ